jgi:sterol desaturase/sphingolipid hydroxylase (fatty acid hydroxylase superfamily)
MKNPMQMGVKMVRIMTHCKVTLDLVNVVAAAIFWMAWDAKNHMIVGAKNIQTKPNIFFIVFILFFLVHDFLIHLIG